MCLKLLQDSCSEAMIRLFVFLLNVVFIIVGIVFCITGIWMEVVYVYIEVRKGFISLTFRNTRASGSYSDSWMHIQKITGNKFAATPIAVGSTGLLTLIIASLGLWGIIRKVNFCLYFTFLSITTKTPLHRANVWLVPTQPLWFWFLLFKWRSSCLLSLPGIKPSKLLQKLPIKQ